MKKGELRELYQMMFPEYPDIVTVKELREMLGISRKLAYKLIDYGYIHAVKIGTTLKIPKISVINYVMEKEVKMVDDGKIAFNPAVELSYLDSYQQRAVLDAMALNDCTPSHAQSIRLKKLAQEGLLDDQIVYAVLAETKPNQQEQLKFKREELRKYFPSGYTEEQMRRDIIKGLELLKRQRERNRDAR